MAIAKDALIHTLLGGGQYDKVDVGVQREGVKIVLPEKMTIEDGIKALQRKLKEEQTMVAINEEVDRLKKEALDRIDELKPIHQKLWDGLENRLREMGKLPSDFKRSTHTIHYNTKANVLGISTDREKKPELDTLDQLKGAPPEIIAAIKQAIKDSGGKNIHIQTIEID
mgnify:CR=1 FL=1